MPETQTSPIVWNSKSGRQWLIEVEVDSSFPHRCASIKVSGFDPLDAYPDAEVTGSLLRELPIAHLRGLARRRIQSQEAFGKGLLRSGLFYVMTRTNVIEVLESPVGRPPIARIPEGPVDRSRLGRSPLPDVPREPSTGTRGAPRIARSFLEEIAEVHQIAVAYGLPRIETLRRFLSVLVDADIDKKRLGRYLAACRDLKLI